jgi:hypothetical protein
MNMNRRALLNVAAATGAAALLAVQSAASTRASNANTVTKAARSGPFVTAKDGTRLYVQDWGSGRPILFVSAWALNSGYAENRSSSAASTATWRPPREPTQSIKRPNRASRAMKP